MGTAAAYYRAKEGAKVLVLDKYDIPNTMGSHDGMTRMLRLNYGNGSSYVPIAKEALDYCMSHSDIVTVATSGPVKPKINSDSVKPGALILLTGSASFEQSFYSEHRMVADYWSMHEKWLQDGLNHPDGIQSILDWAPTGELLELIHNEAFDRNSITDIGDIIGGKKEGRKSADEIIVCFTGGLPTEDVAWGHTIYKNALKKKLGTVLPLWQNSYLTE